MREPPSESTDASRDHREDQDERIHPLWLEEIDRNGIVSEMGDIFAEDAIRKGG